MLYISDLTYENLERVIGFPTYVVLNFGTKHFTEDVWFRGNVARQYESVSGFQITDWDTGVSEKVDIHQVYDLVQAKKLFHCTISHRYMLLYLYPELFLIFVKYLDIDNLSMVRSLDNNVARLFAFSCAGFKDVKYRISKNGYFYMKLSYYPEFKAKIIGDVSEFKAYLAKYSLFT